MARVWHDRVWLDPKPQNQMEEAVNAAKAAGWNDLIGWTIFEMRTQKAEPCKAGIRGLTGFQAHLPLGRALRSNDFDLPLSNLAHRISSMLFLRAQAERASDAKLQPESGGTPQLGGLDD